MAMHQGLDLSRFKKVSKDKNCTTLRHSAGHELKIAHSALTPKMKEQLDKLEMADGGKVRKLAEGGEPSAESDAGAVPEQSMPDPAPIQEPASPSPQAQVVPAQNDTSQQPSDAAAQQTPPDQPIPNNGKTVAMLGLLAPALDAASVYLGAKAAEPSEESDPNYIDIKGERPKPTPQQVAQAENAEDAAVQQDFQRGKITPKTYSQLFHYNEDGSEKSTLGKIGTLFGLMLSGAGSGLTHQPNALLDMMNKQINNDLEAQKSSNENALNWYRLRQQHTLQLAQIPLMQAQRKLAEAQTGKIPAETAYLDAQREYLDTQKTKNYMLIAAGHHVAQIPDRLPDGPLKDQAINAANGVNQAITAEVQKNNADIANRLNAIDKIKNPGQTQKPNPNDPIDFNRFHELDQKGQWNESLGLPGGIRAADRGPILKEAQDVADNRAIARIYKDSFQKLDQMALAGKLNPNERAAYMNTIGAEIARATTNRYSAPEAAAQADGMFPDFKDYGKARPEKYRKAMEHFKANEAGTTYLDNYSLKTPWPKDLEPTNSKTPKEGTESTSKGRPIIFRNGKWELK